MIIPMPRVAPLKQDYSGLSFFSRMVAIIKSRPQFVLIDNWIVTLDDGQRLIVPSGFVTDFASVPRLFWLIPGLSPYGPLLCGSILHDFGYQYGYLLDIVDDKTEYPIKSRQAEKDFFPVFGYDTIPVFIGYPQRFFDNLLSGMTVEVSGSKFVASAADTALYFFGHIAWNKYRDKGPTAYGQNTLGLPWVDCDGTMTLNNQTLACYAN
jgi:hypothetical protein